MEKILLASQSPRRKELLESFHVPFEVVHVDVNEEDYKAQSYVEIIEEIAVKKAKAAQELYPNRTILAADTGVVYGNRIYGKPGNELRAKNTLIALSGKTHEVVTAWCLIHNGILYTKSSITRVTMRTLSDSLINKYLSFNEYVDKAGAYGIQGAGALIVERIEGDYYNVVGLPIGEVMLTLYELGIVV